MQIIDHIHALKIPFTINDSAGRKVPRFGYSYLICGKKICLIDSGVAGSENIILNYLEKTGISPQDITRLILTHSHPDHIGAARAMKRISGCTVLAHAAEKSWIEDTDLQAKERPVPGFHSLVAGSIRVDRTVQDGEIVALEEGLALLVLHTPGHSAGSISLWLAGEGALFSADAVPIPGDMPIYQDISESVRSIKRLASLPEIKHLLPAWDEPRLGGEAYRVMAEGLRYLERIHGCVLEVDLANQNLNPIELCPLILTKLGLPQTMANPQVAASFQASLKAEMSDPGRICSRIEPDNMPLT